MCCVVMTNAHAICPHICTGFDDPEVMAAVSDVAANPKNITKYKNNKKVRRGMSMRTCVRPLLQNLHSSAHAGFLCERNR